MNKSSLQEIITNLLIAFLFSLPASYIAVENFYECYAGAACLVVPLIEIPIYLSWGVVIFSILFYLIVRKGGKVRYTFAKYYIFFIFGYFLLKVLKSIT